MDNENTNKDEVILEIPSVSDEPKEEPIQEVQTNNEQVLEIPTGEEVVETPAKPEVVPVATEPVQEVVQQAEVVAPVETVVETPTQPEVVPVQEQTTTPNLTPNPETQSVVEKVQPQKKEDNMAEERGYMAMLLFIIGVVLAYGFKNVIGIVIVAVALLFSLINLKYKHKLIKLATFLSLVVLIYFGATFFLAKAALEKTLDQIESRNATSCETKFVDMARNHVAYLEIKPEGKTIFTNKDFDLERGCNYEWYVEYDPSTETYTAYLNGNGYTTNGFDASKLNK